MHLLNPDSTSLDVDAAEHKFCIMSEIEDISSVEAGKRLR